jgi:hypothetical protein
MPVKEKVWLDDGAAFYRYGVLIKRWLGWRILSLDGLGRPHASWSLFKPSYRPRVMLRRARLMR